MSIPCDVVACGRCYLTQIFSVLSLEKHLMLFVLSITYLRRLPLSSFLVDVLRHFRVNISQLSMIGAAKHSAKNVTRDPTPVSANFSAQDYATLVAHPSQFRKFPEESLCLVGLSRHYTLDEETYPLCLDKDGKGECLLLYICCVLQLAVSFLTVLPFLRFVDMNIFAFIHTPDPTKVKVAERQRVEGEPRLLETTVVRIVPLLPVAPDRAEGELEASVDKLFDEGSSENQTDQGDFAGSGGGGEGVNIQPVIEVADVAENVALAQPRRQQKRKTLAIDAGGPSHPPKKLKDDHGILSGPSVAGKSSAPQRFVISSNSSRHSGAYIAEAEVDSFARPSVPVITTTTTITSTVDPAMAVKEKVVKPSIFSTDSTSAGGTDHAMGGFTDLTSNDLLVGGIRTVIDPESDLHKVYIPQ
ncbi:hypothetical protein Tco_0657131 [Tanacetum coccineum]|uniref:Uncharacterized protein n=1 Tax=Tanacetum coccineum TaxID=301880 RepID=A0ABQ4XBB9_9ASTR